MVTKKKQVADQTLKGAIVGLISYILSKANVDAEAQAVILPVVFAALAYGSTLVGDKNIASFISQASKKDYSALIKAAEIALETTEIPVVPTPPTEDLGAPVKKAVAKKEPAKKAAPKTPATKK